MSKERTEKIVRGLAAALVLFPWFTLYLLYRLLAG